MSGQQMWSRHKGSRTFVLCAKTMFVVHFIFRNNICCQAKVFVIWQSKAVKCRPHNNIIKIFLIGKVFNECTVEMIIYLLVKVDKEAKFVVLWDHYFISRKQKELCKD